MTIKTIGVMGLMWLMTLVGRAQQDTSVEEMIAYQSGLGGGGGGFSATKLDAATPVYLSRSGDFTGVADSKLVTGSFWFKLNDAAQDATHRNFLKDSSIISAFFEASAEFVAVNDFAFLSPDSAGNNALRFATAATFTASPTWHQIMFAADLSDNTKRAVYVDGVADVTDWVTYSNAPIHWANGGDIGIGASSTGVGASSISLSEVWIAVGQYVDLTLSANRLLFRSGTGHPVDLGATGNTPTGTAPTVYLHNSFATFQNNLGTGGNFTANGTLQNDASTP